MKRAGLLRCICLFTALCFLPAAAVGADAEPSSFDVSTLIEKYAVMVNAAEPSVTAYGVEKNADERCYPASTTKILTCLIALENGALDDVITISENAVKLSRVNSKMGCKAGERYTLNDLLYGLMLPSGNDAAIAIAEHFGGSVEGFAKIMNARAQELGMTHSHFVTPNGLHDTEHYTTARDMAILTAAALQNAVFRTIFGTVSYEVCALNSGSTPYVVKTTDRLIVDGVRENYTPLSYLYEYCIGGKTGSTRAAGRCLIAAAEYNGAVFIVVLLGDYASTAGMKAEEADAAISVRFQEAGDLFRYAYAKLFANFDPQELAAAGLPTRFAVEIQTCPGDATRLALLQAEAQFEEDAAYACNRDTYNALLGELDTLPTLQLTSDTAPITAGQCIGSVSYTYQGETLFTAQLIALSDIEAVQPSPTPTLAPTPQQSLVTSPAPQQSDPAAAPWLWFLLAALLLPLLMIAIGLLFRKHAPQRINPIYGYRTKRSMRSGESWRFAQSYCGRLWLFCGMSLVPLSILTMLFGYQRDMAFVAWLCMGVIDAQLVLLFGSIFAVEAALKREFDKEGKRKTKPDR